MHCFRGIRIERQRSSRKVWAVDLFCGAGGLTHGLERAGIDVRLGVDIDPACEYPFSANNKARFLLKPVEELTPSDIERFFRKNGIRLLAGCAPCQTFSTYNQKATPDDKRWWLLRQFSRLVQEISPELVTMENVPRLESQGVFDEFLGTLRDARYHIDRQIVNCEEYGIPQHRQRLVLLASKLGPIRLMSPSEFGADRTTVRKSIADLPSLQAGEKDETDPLHQAAILSHLNKKRIEASKPGGTWRDWRGTLVAECHRKGTGKTYPSVYGRMCWDEPAPTITTQFFGFGNGRFGHPEKGRSIRLRYAALFQSFSRKYVFWPRDRNLNRSAVSKFIGNVDPPSNAGQGARRDTGRRRHRLSATPLIWSCYALGGKSRRPR